MCDMNEDLDSGDTVTVHHYERVKILCNERFSRCGRAVWPYRLQYERRRHAGDEQHRAYRKSLVLIV